MPQGDTCVLVVATLIYNPGADWMLQAQPSNKSHKIIDIMSESKILLQPF